MGVLGRDNEPVVDWRPYISLRYIHYEKLAQIISPR